LAHEWILEGLPEHLQSQHLKLIENKTPNDPPRENVVKVEKHIETDVAASREIEKARLHTRGGEKPASQSQSQSRLPSAKKAQAHSTSVSKADLRYMPTQQSMGDLSNLYQKNKIHLNINNTEEDSSVINITINLQEKNQPHRKVSYN